MSLKATVKPYSPLAGRTGRESGLRFGLLRDLQEPVREGRVPGGGGLGFAPVRCGHGRPCAPRMPHSDCCLQGGTGAQGPVRRSVINERRDAEGREQGGRCGENHC